MRILILFFSGTGNTHHVARYLQQRLEGVGLVVDLRALEHFDLQEAPDYDLLVLGFPTYFVDAPSLVQRAIAQMPPVTDRGAFVFATYGMVPGGVARRNLERLAAIGYTPLGGVELRLPGSDGLMFLHPRSWYARRAIGGQYDRLPRADRLVEHVLAAASGLARGESLSSHLAPLPPGLHGRLFDRVWRWVFAQTRKLALRFFRADSTCARCGLCARICPVGNITVDERGPHWGQDCQVCLRCLHQCPIGAIQLSGATRGKLRWRGPKGDYRPTGS